MDSLFLYSLWRFAGHVLFGRQFNERIFEKAYATGFPGVYGFPGI
jgi:hypothetical protein